MCSFSILLDEYPARSFNPWFDKGVTVSIRRVSGAQFALLAPTLVDIYLEAMDYNPSIRASRIEAWRREVIWPGFTAVVAFDDSAVVGVAYGFLGSRDRWWDKQLRKGLIASGGINDHNLSLLGNYFEVAEVHVNPNYQGAGIGTQLITELLRTTPAAWALLSTPEVAGEDNNAFHLYRKMGFVDILRDFLYTGDRRPFAVLGRELPLNGAE